MQLHGNTGEMALPLFHHSITGELQANKLGLNVWSVYGETCVAWFTDALRTEDFTYWKLMLWIKKTVDRGNN